MMPSGDWVTFSDAQRAGGVNPRAAQAALDFVAAQTQFALQIAQGGTYPLLNDRMIKRHIQHLIYGHLLLMGPGEQMGKVFGVRSDHLRTEEATASLLSIDMQQAQITQHDARSSLVFK